MNKMRSIGVVMLAGLFTATAVVVQAQSPVLAKMAGTWVMDLAKTPFAPGADLRFRRGEKGGIEELRGADPKAITASLESVIRDLDPEFDPARIMTGAWLRKNNVNDFLTQSAVGGVVGGVLLLLAALGIYGVVGLMVATRIREIAVRVALGASRRRVIGMVLFDVVKLVVPGVGIGVLIAVAFVKLNGQDFGIPLSGLEPLAYVAGAAVALCIAVLASLAPAPRAASIEPMIAMRTE